MRRTLLILHVGGLVLGLAMASLAVRSVVENLPTDQTTVALSRIATASTIAAIAIAYVVVLLRRGFTPSAPFLYALSFGVAGMIVEANGRMMAKHFAPSMATGLDYVVSTAWITGAWLIAFCAVVWTYRQSRFPLI